MNNMKDLFSEISFNNLLVLLLILIVGVFLTVTIFKIRGLFKLITNVIGMVLEQLCTLLVEAVYLFFKIVNTLEVYIILLVDALTGKTSSNGKIAALAIGVLSVASFYTTFEGMSLLVTNSTIGALITLGIQAILLAVSLQIGDNMAMADEDKRPMTYGRPIMCATVLCIGAAVLAYVMGLMDFSYGSKKILYGILYLTAIGAAVAAIVGLVRELAEAECKNFRRGVMLYVIYFSVLTVSSFFSYNQFVTTMYPEKVRTIDYFSRYRTGVIHVLEDMNHEIDDNYYEKIGLEIRTQLEKISSDFEEWSQSGSNFLSDIEKGYYARSAEFEKYADKQARLEEVAQEKKKLETEYEVMRMRILENSGGIGYNTSRVWDSEKEVYEERKRELEDESGLLKKWLDENKHLGSEIQGYLSAKEKMDSIQSFTSKRNMVHEIMAELGRDSFTKEEGEILTEKINEVHKLYTLYADNQEKGGELTTMIQVYIQYKTFCSTYDKTVKEFMNMNSMELDYEEIRNAILDSASEVLSLVPSTQHVFFTELNGQIRTKEIKCADYYNALEMLYRNSNQDLNAVEKNIRVFNDNKMIGLICTLLAVLIDMMILFVGLVLPKNIDLSDISNYTDQEKRRVLSNIFNKPSKR